MIEIGGLNIDVLELRNHFFFDAPFSYFVCFRGNNEEVVFEGFAWNSTNVLVLSNFKSAHLEVKALMPLQFQSFEKFV